MSGMGYDKRSFIIGMIVAFSECVAGGCKRLALSPPLTREDFEAVRDEACAIIEKHCLLHWHERNEDRPAEGRREWILIAARQETLDAYRQLRAEGYSPMRSLEPFHALLSYDPDAGVSTGYDAYREYFG